MKDIIIAVLVIFLIITGGIAYKKVSSVSPENQIKAYIVDDLHYIIGFGGWDTIEGMKFKIYSVSGQTWDIYPDAKIESFPVTRDFIKKQTK